MVPDGCTVEVVVILMVPGTCTLYRMIAGLLIQVLLFPLSQAINVQLFDGTPLKHSLACTCL